MIGKWSCGLWYVKSVEYNPFKEYECRCYLNKIRKKNKTKTAYSIITTIRGLSASFYKGKIECENGYYSKMIRLWMIIISVSD